MKRLLLTFALIFAFVCAQAADITSISNAFKAGNASSLSGAMDKGIPQNFRELPQVVGGEHPVHVGVAMLDPVGDLGFPGHTATQENFLPGMAALGVG